MRGTSGPVHPHPVLRILYVDRRRQGICASPIKRRSCCEGISARALSAGLRPHPQGVCTSVNPASWGMSSVPHSAMPDACLLALFLGLSVSRFAPFYNLSVCPVPLRLMPFPMHADAIFGCQSEMPPQIGAVCVDWRLLTALPSLPNSSFVPLLYSTQHGEPRPCRHRVQWLRCDRLPRCAQWPWAICPLLSCLATVVCKRASFSRTEKCFFVLQLCQGSIGAPIPSTFSAW